MGTSTTEPMYQETVQIATVTQAIIRLAFTARPAFSQLLLCRLEIQHTPQCKRLLLRHSQQKFSAWLNQHAFSAAKGRIKFLKPKFPKCMCSQSSLIAPPLQPTFLKCSQRCLSAANISWKCSVQPKFLKCSQNSLGAAKIS